jgi:serine phosphatase RsbU (regulator of sigma subunit)
MEYRDGVATLCEGDILFLYTDGTTEARSPSGAFFGEDGLRDMVSAETAGDFDGLLDRCLARLDDFTGRNLNDDVSMVAVRFDELGKGADGQGA